MPKTNRIAIFLPNWVGDVVMATPMLAALHARFGGDHELIGIARPYAAGVLEGAPWLDSLLLYDRQPAADVLTSWQLVKQLRKLGIAKAVLLTNSLRTAVLARLSGARQRIGYARDLRSWLLTERLHPPRSEGAWQPVSAVDYYLELAYALGCTPTGSKVPRLPLTANDWQAAQSAWQQLQLPADRSVIAFHVAGGWGGTATAKAWPIEHFAALARRIVAERSEHVLVLCGPNERAAAAEVVRLANHPRVTSLANIDALSLSLTKGCLARSALLVTTDSGPRHVATALDVPVVALFGATDPRWTDTYHPHATTIFNKLDCGPCKQKHCPLAHHRCMRDLSVERVLAAMERRLTVGNRRAA